jgi:hypothetical protein
MAEKKKSLGRALVVEMTHKRMTERIPLRKICLEIKAQYATVWRWETKGTEPNSFHTYQLRKWLGYL